MTALLESRTVRLCNKRLHIRKESRTDTFVNVLSSPLSDNFVMQHGVCFFAAVEKMEHFLPSFLSILKA